MANKESWYSMSMSSGTIEIYLYGIIGYWDISDIQFLNDFRELEKENPGAPIELHINSPGGNVQMGMGIYAIMKRVSDRVTTFIDGWAVSMASIIALSGSKVFISPSGMFMIHDPSGGAYGNASEIRKFADVLDQVKSTMVPIYMEKSGLSEEEVTSMMLEETWMNAEQAKELGFIDEIGLVGSSAQAHFDAKKIGVENFAKFKEEYAVAAGPAFKGESMMQKIMRLGRTVTAENKPKETDMFKDLTIESLRKERPDLVAELIKQAEDDGKKAASEAVASAVNAALERVKKISSKLEPHHFEKDQKGESLATSLLSGDTSVEDAFGQIIDANRKHDEMLLLQKETNATLVPETNDAGKDATPEQQGAKLLQAAVDNVNKERKDK